MGNRKYMQVPRSMMDALVSKCGSIQAAAKFCGMPSQTFHSVYRNKGKKCAKKTREAIKAGHARAFGANEPKAEEDRSFDWRDGAEFPTEETKAEENGEGKRAALLALVEEMTAKTPIEQLIAEGFRDVERLIVNECAALAAQADRNRERNERMHKETHRALSALAEKVNALYAELM